MKVKSTTLGRVGSIGMLAGFAVGVSAAIDGRWGLAGWGVATLAAAVVALRAGFGPADRDDLQPGVNPVRDIPRWAEAVIVLAFLAATVVACAT